MALLYGAEWGQGTILARGRLRAAWAARRSGVQLAATLSRVTWVGTTLYLLTLPTLRPPTFLPSALARAMPSLTFALCSAICCWAIQGEHVDHDLAVKRLSLSRDLVNILIRRDEPKLVKVGSRRVVPADAITEFRAPVWTS